MRLQGGYNSWLCQRGSHPGRSNLMLITVSVECTRHTLQAKLSGTKTVCQVTSPSFQREGLATLDYDQTNSGLDPVITHHHPKPAALPFKGMCQHLLATVIVHSHLLCEIRVVRLEGRRGRERERRKAGLAIVCVCRGRGIETNTMMRGKWVVPKT